MSADVVFPEDVRGWLTQDEGNLLVGAARGRRALEVGTFCGRSAMLLGQVCPLLVTIDTHLGDGGIGPQDTLVEFYSNLRHFEKRGLLKCVIPMIGRVENVGPLLEKGFASFIYIDGEHYEAAEESNTRAVEHCASLDCIWAFHDYGLGDVQRVALRLATRRHMDVEVHHTTYGLALLRPHSAAREPS